MIEVGKDGVKILIESIDKNSICATVVGVDKFWSSPSRISLLCKKDDGTEIWSINFEVGMGLVFNPSGGKINEPNHLPWFILSIERKTFEHYR